MSINTNTNKTAGIAHAYLKRNRKLVLEHNRHHRSITALLPHWERWFNEAASTLTFKVTQALNGHIYFDNDLRRT